MESSLIYQNAAADTVTNTKIEPREYKATANQEMLIIEPNDLKTIDMYFQNGQALEFIYKLYVQEEFPIDVWFVNDENYTKFINGNEYKYFIDGSEKQVIFTTKVVSLTEYDSYTCHRHSKFPQFRHIKIPHLYIYLTLRNLLCFWE